MHAVRSIDKNENRDRETGIAYTHAGRGIRGAIDCPRVMFVSAWASLSCNIRDRISR
jgi:hypothetical protein